VLEVIGAGFGRTGTLSLKLALERLGFGPCYHMIELIDDPGRLGLWEAALAGNADWEQIFRGYRATVDWPGVAFWRQLVARYPAAKVILTVRDRDSWYESARDSIYRVSSSPWPADARGDPRRDFVIRLVWEKQFGGRFEDAEHAMAVFDEHYDAVRREVPADRLLEFHVRDGWQPLCDFLGVPVPDEPFPRTNDRQEFAARVSERLREERGGLGTESA
jgi:Sulfotransferase domain